MNRLAFEPYIPLALWAPLALAAIGLLIAYAILSRRRLSGWRHAAAVTLMSLAVALPLAILLNPTWITRLPPPEGKPLLTLLVDRSQSMATADDGDHESRFAAAKKIAARFERELGDQFEIELQTFAATSSPATVASLDQETPDGAVSDLAGVIESALTDRAAGQAILLLSDGVHNAGGGLARLRTSAERAKAMAVPVFSTTLGRPTGVRDLEVSLHLPEELAFVGQETPIAATIRQRGSLTTFGKLVVRLDDKTVDSRNVPLTQDGSREETITLKHDAPGLFRYDIELEPIKGEATAVNNHATLMLRVVDEPVRVLLLEGKPYWDTKFLVRTLAADPSIRLTSMVRLTEGRYLERRIRHPSDVEPKPEATTETAVSDEPQPEEWEIRTDGRILDDPAALAKFQVVVLGRDAEFFLTDDGLVRLKQWLAAGDGSLVCFRGPPSSQISKRLGDLLPVRWSPGRESRFRVHLTQSGRTMGWLPPENEAGGMPSLSSVMRAERPKPLAVVLATNGEREESDPVITYQPLGNGRVVVVEGAGMWRWAFLPAQFQQHDAVYGRLWRSLTRWLAANAGLRPSQQMALRSDKVVFTVSDEPAGTLLLRDVNAEPPEVEVTGGALEQRRIVRGVRTEDRAGGEFRVVFGKLPEGRYRARVVGAKADEVGTFTAFDVHGNYSEQLDVAARADLMKMIAQFSGGAALDGGDPAELVEKLRVARATDAAERTQRTPAWDRWWVLVGVFGAWTISWAVRRRSGLI